MRKHYLAVLTAVVTAGLFGFAAPAQAEEPTAETRTVVTDLVDRADHGHGTPPPAIWALDDFTRTVEITGGPDYVLHEQPSLVADEPTVPADIDQQVADAKKVDSKINVCDLVKTFHLRWQYHAEVNDEGTFMTVAGAHLSPNAGAALLGNAPGTLTGGFTADFVAPAHWCSFDDSKLNGKELEGDDAPATSKWLKFLFGDKLDGSGINDDWSWTYNTCSEQWIDAASNDDGQEDEAGDITGKPCPTPSPSPTPPPTTAPPVVVVGAQLPVTGASVSVPAVVGGALVVLGAAILAGLAITRRRRVA